MQESSASCADDLRSFLIGCAGSAGHKRARTSAISDAKDPIKAIDNRVEDAAAPEEDAAATLIFLSRSFAQDRNAESEKKICLPPLTNTFEKNTAPPQPGDQPPLSVPDQLHGCRAFRCLVTELLPSVWPMDCEFDLGPRFLQGR